MKRSKFLIFIVIFFLLGIGAGILYSRGKMAKSKEPQAVITNKVEGLKRQSRTLNIFFPSRESLQMEQRIVEIEGSLVETALTEFFKGPAGAKEPFEPSMVGVLGVYNGIDGIIYVNLSDEVRKNFSDTALYEFLFLRALFETVISASAEMKDVKILVEGKEIETIGGHISIIKPLRETIFIDGGFSE